MICRATLAAVALLTACSDRNKPPAPAVRDAGPKRRVIVPAPADVRPLPPHAIRADGVGPYKLGARLDQLLAGLPSGPRVWLLDLQGVVDWSVVRAEDDGVLVGGESVADSAAFVAVVRPDVARTESGVGVGATRGELEAAMGVPLVDPRVARDPALLAFAALPGARFVLDGDRVGAVLLRRPSRETAELPGPVAGGGTGTGRPPRASGSTGDRGPASARDQDPGTAACGSGPNPEAAAAASGVEAPRVVSTCLGASGEVVIVGDTNVVVMVGDAERARRLTALELQGVRFAAPVRESTRDELVVVTSRASEENRAMAVAVYRLEGAKLLRVSEQDAYRVTAASASWIGARLVDLDLLLEIEARGDVIVVSGVLVHRKAGQVRDLAPLEPITLARRRRGSASDSGVNSVAVPDAGTVDAGEDAPPAAP